MSKNRLRCWCCNFEFGGFLGSVSHGWTLDTVWKLSCLKTISLRVFWQRAQRAGRGRVCLSVRASQVSVCPECIRFSLLPTAYIHQTLIMLLIGIAVCGLLVVTCDFCILCRNLSICEWVKWISDFPLKDNSKICSMVPLSQSISCGARISLSAPYLSLSLSESQNKTDGLNWQQQKVEPKKNTKSSLRLCESFPNKAVTGANKRGCGLKAEPDFKLKK